MIILDASALLALLLQRDDVAGWLDERVREHGPGLHAPHLIDLEIASALRTLHAGDAAAEIDPRQALEDLARARLVRHPHRPALLRRVWELRENVTVYDAAYVALAEALDAPLLTLDLRLTRAPGPTCRMLAPPA